MYLVTPTSTTTGKTIIFNPTTIIGYYNYYSINGTNHTYTTTR